ncbi:MAG: aldehyde dehydrogenase (NADP(+)) [Acidimicrobiales bacterium]
MSRVISVNPATGESVELSVEDSSAEDVARLAHLAALAAPLYGHRPLTWRAELLRAMADELEAEASSLVELAHRETALPMARLEGEVRRTAFQLRFFADVVLDAHFLEASIDHATESPMGPLPDLRRIRVPLGPVAVFGSSNFPFAFSVPGGDTASALAAGCPVVIKAHPAHPATSLASFQALERAAQRLGAPEVLLSLVFGLDAGVALVDAPEISAVGFTGSVSAGQFLWRRANERPTPIPFFGELGSANPLVVTPHAAAERSSDIGRGTAASMTLGVGQFCTKPGLLFVPSGSSGDDLVATLVDALEAQSPMTMLSDSIASHFRTGIAEFENVPGVQSLVVHPDGEGAQAGAQLFEVTAASFANGTTTRLREECFGPVALVVRYDNRADLENALDATEPSLTFSVFRGVGNDDDAARLLRYAPSRAGRVIVDGYPTGVGVSWSMEHGGPWPATTQPSATSVGAASIERWVRPVTYQNVPEDLLPEALRDANPWGIPQRVDGVLP